MEGALELLDWWSCVAVGGGALTLHYTHTQSHSRRIVIYLVIIKSRAIWRKNENYFFSIRRTSLAGVFKIQTRANLQVNILKLIYSWKDSACCTVKWLMTEDYLPNSQFHTIFNGKQEAITERTVKLYQPRIRGFDRNFLGKWKWSDPIDTIFLF